MNNPIIYMKTTLNELIELITGNKVSIFQIIFIVTCFYMIGYIIVNNIDCLNNIDLFDNIEGFNNIIPGEYPKTFNVEKPKICKKKELCRPIYNCRRVGFYCSAIN